jgi:hypothetical protein
MRKIGQRPDKRGAVRPAAYLGLAATALPAYEETPAVIAEAAMRLGSTPARLQQQNPDLLAAMCREMVLEATLQPRSEANPTEHVLIPARFVGPQGHRLALVEWEDRSTICGRDYKNPARWPEGNPVGELFTKYNTSLEEVATANDQGEAPEVLDTIRKDLRRWAGVVGSHLTDEEVDYLIVDCNTPAAELLPAYKELAARMGVQNLLKHLRLSLPADVAAGVADVDLLQAIDKPHNPLFCSGLARMQVLDKQAFAALLRTDFATFQEETSLESRTVNV